MGMLGSSALHPWLSDAWWSTRLQQKQPQKVGDALTILVEGQKESSLSPLDCGSRWVALPVRPAGFPASIPFQP